MSLMGRGCLIYVYPGKKQKLSAIINFRRSGIGDVDYPYGISYCTWMVLIDM